MQNVINAKTGVDTINENTNDRKVNRKAELAELKKQKFADSQEIAHLQLTVDEQQSELRILETKNQQLEKQLQQKRETEKNLLSKIEQMEK